MTSSSLSFHDKNSTFEENRISLVPIKMNGHLKLMYIIIAARQ